MLIVKAISKYFKLSFNTVQCGILILFIAYTTIGCSSGSAFFPDYYGSERKQLRSSIRKAPDWVRSSRVMWYENGSFYVVGKAFNHADIGFAEVEGKAFAAKNIAEKIQSTFNSRLTSELERRDEEIRSNSDLALSLITENLPLSIATTEVYWYEYRTVRGIRYDVYTLNVISEGAVRFAVSESLRRLRNKASSRDLKELLMFNDLEDDIIEGMK